jgi:hypothetical protein
VTRKAHGLEGAIGRCTRLQGCCAASWPGDTYEVTQAMAMALQQRGYQAREDFIHLAFPLEEHDERAWGRRLHCPSSWRWVGPARPDAAGSCRGHPERIDLKAASD